MEIKLQCCIFQIALNLQNLLSSKVISKITNYFRCISSYLIGLVTVLID